MNNQLNYSFDDEPVVKFCYDIQNKKIEIYFDRYFDLEKNIFVESKCVLIIEKWQNAYSMLSQIEKKHELNRHIGVFSMILYLKSSEEYLEMLVNTLDNRYVTLIFESPEIVLE